MSARDIYDERRWDPNRGVMVGVNYGGTVHSPYATYSDIPFGGVPFLSGGPKYGEDYDPYRNTSPSTFPKQNKNDFYQFLDNFLKTRVVPL